MASDRWCRSWLRLTVVDQQTGFLQQHAPHWGLGGAEADTAVGPLMCIAQQHPDLHLHQALLSPLSVFYTRSLDLTPIQTVGFLKTGRHVGSAFTSSTQGQTWTFA